MANIVRRLVDTTTSWLATPGRKSPVPQGEGDGDSSVSWWLRGIVGDRLDRSALRQHLQSTISEYAHRTNLPISAELEGNWIIDVSDVKFHPSAGYGVKLHFGSFTVSEFVANVVRHQIRSVVNYYEITTNETHYLHVPEYLFGRMFQAKHLPDLPQAPVVTQSHLTFWPDDTTSSGNDSMADVRKDFMSGEPGERVAEIHRLKLESERLIDRMITRYQYYQMRSAEVDITESRILALVPQHLTILNNLKSQIYQVYRQRIGLSNSSLPLKEEEVAVLTNSNKLEDETLLIVHKHDKIISGGIASLEKEQMDIFENDQLKASQAAGNSLDELDHLRAGQSQGEQSDKAVTFDMGHIGSSPDLPRAPPLQLPPSLGQDQKK